MSGGRRLWILLGLLPLAACGTDRDRPAPPQLSITFDRDSVGPFDTLRYTITAKDPDFVDSMYVVVDSQAQRSYDALLLSTAVLTDTTHVRSSHVLGQHIQVKFWARDGNGWADTLYATLIAKGL